MKTELTSKKGITLIEVVISMIIMGILAMSGASYFGSAARFRMQARHQQAALMQAESLMERAFSASGSNEFVSVSSDHHGFYDPDNAMAYTSSDPEATWLFDGSQLPQQVALAPAGGGLQAVKITATVSCIGLRPVILTAYRLCED